VRLRRPAHTGLRGRHVEQHLERSKLPMIFLTSAGSVATLSRPEATTREPS
jgi:hypothetical protein